MHLASYVTISTSFIRANTNRIYHTYHEHMKLAGCRAAMIQKMTIPLWHHGFIIFCISIVYPFQTFKIARTGLYALRAEILVGGASVKPGIRPWLIFLKPVLIFLFFFLLLFTFFSSLSTYFSSSATYFSLLYWHWFCISYIHNTRTFIVLVCSSWCTLNSLTCQIRCSLLLC